MIDSLKRLSYRPEVLKPIQKLGLSRVLRRAYFQVAKPASGILEIEIAGQRARFYARTPEELRILESAGGAGGEQRVQEALANFLKPGDVALDIGANVGLYTVLLARAVGAEGLVIACEPSGQNYSHLEENLKLNGLANVRLFRKALGNSSGRARLYASSVIGNSSLSGDENHNAGAEDVEVIEADRLIASEKLPVPRAVKIDVEGFEYAVLEGLQATLKSPGCQLVACEVHPGLLPEGVEPGAIAGLLQSCGFSRIQHHSRWDKTFHVVATKGGR
ncbi:MAG TPA: FkbM family methyltransferase [Terriglobia bacterium]|nr:FkbM family methyltransferase [Terriglobia bacterium]